MKDKIEMPNGFASPPAEKEDSLSPCIDVCKLDDSFVCEGCGRTIDEILKWPEYTEQEKQQVLDRLF